MTITLQDICFLRMAAAKAGTTSIPADAATRLVHARLISGEADSPRMKITTRGELALRRLG